MDLTLKYPPTAEFAPQLADLAVAAAKDISHIELDFSAESLHALEDIIERFCADGLSVDDIGSSLFCFGCYLGEVLTRNLGGIWVATSASPMASYAQWPMVIKMDKGDWWNPIGKLFKRFTDGEGESLPYFYSLASG